MLSILNPLKRKFPDAVLPHAYLCSAALGQPAFEALGMKPVAGGISGAPSPQTPPPVGRSEGGGSSPGSPAKRPFLLARALMGGKAAEEFLWCDEKMPDVVCTGDATPPSQTFRLKWNNPESYKTPLSSAKDAPDCEPDVPAPGPEASAVASAPVDYPLTPLCTKSFLATRAALPVLSRPEDAFVGFESGLHIALSSAAWCLRGIYNEEQRGPSCAEMEHAFWVLSRLYRGPHGATDPSLVPRPHLLGIAAANLSFKFHHGQGATRDELLWVFQKVSGTRLGGDEGAKRRAIKVIAAHEWWLFGKMSTTFHVALMADIAENARLREVIGDAASWRLSTVIMCAYSAFSDGSNPGDIGFHIEGDPAACLAACVDVATMAINGTENNHVCMREVFRRLGLAPDRDISQLVESLEELYDTYELVWRDAEVQGIL